MGLSTMVKQIKSFEIREDGECPKVYIDGELYKHSGRIRSIDIEGRGGFLISVKSRNEEPIIFNNSLVENVDKFCIFKENKR